MPYKVLVVDDSIFFRRRLQKIIDEHPELQVVGVAANGQEAVKMAEALSPDIISMDYEMPVMDGVTAIKTIMAKHPVPILMFSSMTYKGARITLDSLAAGAVDYISKDFAEVSQNTQKLKQKLHQRLLDIIRSQAHLSAIAPSTDINNTAISAFGTRAENQDLKHRIKILVLGASTGGPVALTQIIKALPQTFPIPIVLVQHMPGNFTQAFAERLDRQCQLSVKEAVNGDRLQAGTVLLAPGGKQLIIDSKKKDRVKILKGDGRANHNPSIDITFTSVANVFGNGSVGIVLTGMGRDACEGARILKQKESVIWSQDETSSVIYGMPMAVANSSLSDKVLALEEFAPALKAVFC